MNPLKSISLNLILFISLLWLCNCTFTQSYTPQFNDKLTAVLDTIKTSYGFENITFIAKKRSGTGGQNCTLTVKFINGKNIPTDVDKTTDLAKQLGSKIKTIVKNPKEFNNYIILFSTIKTDGNTTNENYTGHEFKQGEL